VKQATVKDKQMFENILNWRLLIGSHKFPGPDGGTCINEAAVVVAGLKYRSIGDIGDLPLCFSRPIGAYTIKINDSMPDDLRQELLLPFVTRLAGTSDTPKIERKRADLIVTRTVTDILPIALRIYGLESYAVLCEGVKTRKKAHMAAKLALEALSVAIHSYSAAAAYAAAYAANAAHAVNAAYAASAVVNAANAAVNGAEAVATDGLVAAAADYAACAAHAADSAVTANDAAASCAARAADTAIATIDANAMRRLIWILAIAILDAALRIGRQAEPIETATIIARAEAAKKQPRLALV
jgi:hypothetical protein